MRTVLWTCWWIMVGWIGSTGDCWAQTCGPNGCPFPSGSSSSIGHSATCRIVNTLPSGVRCIGSGTLVDREEKYGLIITCQHLFQEGVGTIRVGFSNGETFWGRLLHQDRAADLAALLIARPSADPVPVATNLPQPGEEVWSCGYGPDGRYGCNRGRVVGYVRTAQMSSWETLELTGQARQGDSGGPVLNARGELVAVLWGTDGRTVDGTYCGRVDRFLLQTGRYLFPWNARNDPGNRIPASPGTNASDLARIEARLDRIVELLGQGRPAHPEQTVPGPSGPNPSGPPPLPSEEGAARGSAAEAPLDRQPGRHDSSGSTFSAGSRSEEKARSDSSILEPLLRDLLGEIGSLPDRFQARLEKVQAAGAQTTRETVRTYVQDFWAEKLADGSVGWTLGKLLAGALGLSAPLAVGLTLGAWLISRRIGRKLQVGDPLFVQQLASRITSALASGRESASGSTQAAVPPPANSAA